MCKKCNRILKDNLWGFKVLFAPNVNASEIVSATVVKKFSEATKRLQKYEPIQYIIGVTEFYGLPFQVTPATLIPRPETEELVAWIIENTKHKPVAILDIGTGSGCIPISLKVNIDNYILVFCMKSLLT